MRKLLITLAVFLIFLTSCEEVIDLPLQNSEPALVIEGQVSSLRGQQEVLISETMPFGSEEGRRPISGAEVFLKVNAGSWRQFVEDSTGRYVLESLRGRPGNTYELRVEYNKKVYEAKSTMPELVRIDSTGISTNTIDDFRKTPLVLFQDPEGIKNFYYFKLRINDKEIPSLFIYNDKFNDGKYVLQNLDDFSIKLKEGDSVFIEMQNIEEPIFNYWRGVQSQTGMSASPGNPVSNFTNGALGYFSAYSAFSIFFIVGEN